MQNRLVASLAALVLSATAASAFFEPPITSERDAACRAEARAKVFSAPDPEGLGLYAVGKRIYGACMASAAGRSKGRVATAGVAD